MDCLFCKIINREIPSKVIYENDNIIAFLDINPITNGDTLVIPKKHYKDIFEVPDDILNEMNDVYKKLYKIYKDKLKCVGLTLSTNLDYSQEIKHYHMHFIPRYKNDEIKYLSNKKILKDLDKIKNIIND